MIPQEADQSTGSNTSTIKTIMVSSHNKHVHMHLSMFKQIAPKGKIIIDMEQHKKSDQTESCF
jgi:hypothetical protein